MAWLIGLGVLAFMLAPVIWILPSPRQRRQTQIREKARQLGLQVRVVPLPQTRRQRVRQEPQAQVVCYSRSIHRREAGAAWRYWLCPVDEDENTLAEGSPEYSAVQDYRPRLPADGLLLESTGLGLAFYWQERGAQPETIAGLATTLEGIIEAAKLEQ